MCGDVGPGPTAPLADVQPKPHPLKSGRKVATQAAMMPSAGSMTDQIPTSLCVTVIVSLLRVVDGVCVRSWLG